MKTRWLPIIAAIVLCTGFTADEVWVISADSKLAIHGATNINRFTCNLKTYAGHDTLRYFQDAPTSRVKFTANRMTIPVRNFNCGSSQISNDFYHTLKSDKHPTLEIAFVSLESNCFQNNSIVKGIIDITLAGATTRYQVYFTMNNKKGALVLSGHQRMKFSDFKLQAPEKLKGLIRVQETLDVEFDLLLIAV